MEEDYDDYNQEHINKRWQQYIDTVVKVHPLMLKAFEIAENENISLKNAIDIGCGPGNETNFLVEQNIQTLALDYNDECLNKIKDSFPNLIKNKLFSFQGIRIENFVWKSADLMISLKVLPFLTKEIYEITLEKIKINLNSGGLFVASVFGKNDDWQHLSLTSSESIKKIFKNFEELYFCEKEGSLKVVSGEVKKTHLIDFIYRKN